MLAPMLLCYAFVFFIGCCLGSFGNVLVYRIPRRLDFVKGRSFCPQCGHTLAPRDLVPLASYLALHGRCRYCGAGISIRYPLVEACAGLLAVACAARFGFTAGAATVFCIGCVLLVLSLIDADTQEIPDGLIVTLLIPAIASWFLLPGPGLIARLVGMVCVSVPMLLIDFVIPTSFGGGDIKLMAVMGWILGWEQTLLAMFFALLGGGGYGAWLLARGKKGRKEHFAFGPFLALGCMLALFFGMQLLHWYLGLFR